MLFIGLASPPPLGQDNEKITAEREAIKSCTSNKGLSLETTIKYFKESSAYHLEETAETIQRMKANMGND